jgi:hypothetical protein
LTTVVAVALAAILSCAASTAARAQEEEPAVPPQEGERGTSTAESPQEETSSAKAARLAAEFNDPLTTVPQFFLQDAYTPSNYGTDAPTNRVIMRLLTPRVPRFTLLPLVQLIRPTFSLVTVPKGLDSETRTEFGDIQLLDLFVLPWPPKETGAYVGVGPLFIFPTATHRMAGENAWQVGPSFAMIYKGIPGVVVGTLIQNPISFAYTEDDQEPLSKLLVQPIVLVHLWRGLYVKSADATWVFGWRDGTPTTVPLSLGLGWVILREGVPPINVFVTGEWMAYRENAPFAAQTTVRFGLTIAFPSLRPWD